MFVCRAATAFALLFAASCAGGPPPEEPQPVTPAPIVESAPAAPGASSRDAPEISRSRGTPGGVVVLWPRIVLPSTGPRKPGPSLIALARQVQQHLASDAMTVFRGHPVDVRPEPERVCPRSGCVAASVGVLLTQADHGCAALALISAPGKSPERIVPWAGTVTVSDPMVPFRQYPENRVTVNDFVSCSGLIAALSQGDADVEAAMRSVAR